MNTISKNTHRTSHQVKRNYSLKRITIEQESKSVNTSAEKWKNGEKRFVGSDLSINYRILNFLTVFKAISQFVKCKTCNDSINFKIANEHGLGFKILLQCGTCQEKIINSCPLISNAYEINRRFIFASRFLGIDLESAEIFCALMDLPRPLSHLSYETIIRNIHNAAKAACDVSLKRSVNEEQQLTMAMAMKERRETQVDGLTVSGDGIWMKGGYGSLYGIASILGNYSKKVLDVDVKFLYCTECDSMEHLKGTEEHINWMHHHQCSVNQATSVLEIELDGLCEIFKRSVSLYNMRYVNYISDGYGEMLYNGIVDSKPYGDITINKRECINHLKERMGALLRNSIRCNDVGGEDNLSMDLINELTTYYVDAIYRHKNSIADMHDAIWATYYHKCSTDENPQHQYCPKGKASWCKWQQALAKGDVKKFTHQKALHLNIQKILKPIYEDLTKQKLLKKCLGGFRKNNNESFNNLIHKIASKNNYDAQLVRIATYIATCVFNDGYCSLLKIMNILNINVGLNATEFCKKLDEKQMERAENQAQRTTFTKELCPNIIGTTEETASSEEDYIIYI